MGFSLITGLTKVALSKLLPHITHRAKDLIHNISFNSHNPIDYIMTT